MQEKEKEKYKISDVEFILNDDLDIDQSVVASKLLNKLFVSSPNTLQGEYTGDDIENFLAVVLIPADGKPLPEGFSFRKAKESVQMAVFRDFFLLRMKKGMNGASEFAQSMTDQTKQ